MYSKADTLKVSAFLLEKIKTKNMKNTINYLTKEELQKSLQIEDLSRNENHAIGIILNEIKIAIEKAYYKEPIIVRNSPIVNVKDNYDNLYYPTEDITKSSRYTRWVNENEILRTQVTSAIPDILRNHTKMDSIYMVPGLVYRRDVIDRTHISTPSQLDIWRVSSVSKYDRTELLDLVNTVVNTILPNCEWRYNETNHYYTKDGIEVEILYNGNWLEILECGLILPKLLDDCGLDSSIYSGLAMGLGLDRSVMLRKGITDIRLLRHPDPRISKQMTNLYPYKEVSNYPHIIRDISIAISSNIDDELLGDKIRMSISNVEWIEELSIKSETSYENLPKHVSERLGMSEQHKNVLVSMKLRALDHTLTKQETNSVIEQLYKDIHEGTRGYI